MDTSMITTDPTAGEQPYQIRRSQDTPEAREHVRAKNTPVKILKRTTTDERGHTVELPSIETRSTTQEVSHQTVTALHEEGTQQGPYSTEIVPFTLGMKLSSALADKEVDSPNILVDTCLQVARVGPS